MRRRGSRLSGFEGKYKFEILSHSCPWQINEEADAMAGTQCACWGSGRRLWCKTGLPPIGS